jgi:hypothetical protein
MGWFMAADPSSCYQALFDDRGTASMCLNDQFDAYRRASSPEASQRVSHHRRRSQSRHFRPAVASVGKNGFDIGAQLRRHAVELAAAMSELKTVAGEA